MKNNLFQSVKQRMVSIALAAALVTSGIMATPIMQPEVVEAATSTRTITKADSTTAQWIDQQLRDGNSVKLYVKNQKNYAAVKKIMQSLQKKVSALNPYGCTFTFSKSGSFSKKKTTIKVKDSTGAYKTIDAAIASYDSVSAFEASADTLAVNLDAKMMDTNNWTDLLIIVNGSKSAITSACEKLNSKIQQVNKNSIIVNSTVMTVNKTNSWYGVKITEDNAKLYYYSNKFIDKVWEEAQAKAKEVCASGNYSYEVKDPNDEDNHFPVTTIETLMAETENFCDLSDAMKLLAINYVDCWNNSAHSGYEAGSYIGIRYSKPDCNMRGSSWERMQFLYEGTAAGVCHDYANAEILVAEQLGIPCYYASGTNHAWSVAKVTNSDGDSIWVANDYGIGTWSGYDEGLGRYTEESYFKGITNSTIRAQALAELYDENSYTGKHDATYWK